jgi:hypothetical protein
MPMMRSNMSNEAIFDAAIRACHEEELREQAETRRAIMAVGTSDDPEFLNRLINQAYENSRISIRRRLLEALNERRPNR